MDVLLIVQGILVIAIAGCTIHRGYLHWQLHQHDRLLAQQLQAQQQQMDQTFTEIHNDPLQRLAFLIRELQLRDVPQAELLNCLREVYRDIQVGVQGLKK